MAGNNYSPYKVVDVTPTLSTAAYVDGDILFNKVEIPQAVIGNGGTSELINVTVTSKKASWTELEVAIFTNNQSLDSANDPFDITAAHGAAAGFLGWVEFPAAGALDCGDFTFGNPVPAVGKPQIPFLLQAASDSDSVYFVAIVRDGVTYADGDLTFRFHIKQS